MKPISRAILVVIALILVGDGVALSTVDRDGDRSALKWDPRVAQLASFVEDARDLRFKHPVDVRFLTEEEYAKETRADESALTDEDKEDIANIEGELRALGLIDKDASLFDDQSTLISGGTAAFYSPQAEEMVIRGTEMTVGLKVTVVHELTHALQDQHFDLGREFESDSRSTFFQALGEGDASRIENLYIDDLPDAEAEAYFDEQDAQSEGAENAIADVSPALTQLFGAPYALGEPMTSIVVETAGVSRLNALFKNPPASDEGIMNPFALLDEAKPVRVAEPKARQGEKVTDGGDFGALTWYLMLATFIDEKVALNATDGWGGDSFIGYRKNNKGCVRAVFAGDTVQDATEMRGALEQWKTAFQSEAVTVTPLGDKSVELDSCEPAAAPAPRKGSEKSMVVPIVRFEIVGEVLAGGGSRKLAQCAVREFFTRLTVQQLDPQTDEDVEFVQQLGPQIGRICARLGEV